jgi:PAS domain S-box-containing protein
VSAGDELTFARARVTRFLEQLERLAAGEAEGLEISPLHDELDAIAFGIKVLADELRWAHGRMTESERVNFAIAFDFNPCAMAIVRLSDGLFRDVNQSFERQTGYCRDDVIGRTREEIGLWMEEADLAAIDDDIRNGRRIVSRETRYRTKAGAASTALYSADVILFHGEPCVLSASIDITDRVRAETEAAMLRWEFAHRGRVIMLDALTGSLAHELNQPLTAIMNNAHVALDLLKAPAVQVGVVREIVEDVQSDSRRAGEVVSRMRSLLKKGDAERERFDLNELLGTVLKLVESHIAARRIVLVMDLAATRDAIVGDRVQVQQVALNLLMNAFDAAQACASARRRVRLRTLRRGSTAVIEVSDWGAGLTDEALAGIFEPFQTTKREGLGLGLWICRQIMTAHSGTLSATRNADGGMTFTAAFPLAARDVPPQPVANPLPREQSQ